VEDRCRLARVKSEPGGSGTDSGDVLFRGAGDAEMRRLHALLDQGAYGIALSSASGVLEYVSPAVTRILGYAPDELIGRTGAPFTHPEDVERHRSTTRGRDALERITAGEHFDVILCDLMMPNMSGVQLFEEIRRVAPAIAPRVVFLTGGAFTASARELLERVSNPRLEKPFESGTLLALVNIIISGRRASSE
jgi:CheY-like chemotaxis protein